MERKFTREIEQIKSSIDGIKQNHNSEVQKTERMIKEINIVDDKVSKCFAGLNHSRETFLELKKQVFNEISSMREDLYAQFNVLEEEHRQAKLKLESNKSQLENHKSLLNNFDTTIEQINLDMTHKFNLTIKGLQVEKLDKKEFDNKFTFINKIVNS